MLAVTVAALENSAEQQTHSVQILSYLIGLEMYQHICILWLNIHFF